MRQILAVIFISIVPFSTLAEKVTTGLVNGKSIDTYHMPILQRHFKMSQKENA